MKRIIGVIACLAGPALGQSSDEVANCQDKECVGVTADFCMENAEDGFDPEGIVRCIVQENALWDTQMKNALAQAEAVMRDLDDQDEIAKTAFAVRVDRLQEAQAAWIAHRQASCAFETSIFGDNVVNVIAQAGCTLEMTADRVFLLRAVPDMVQ